MTEHVQYFDGAPPTLINSLPKSGTHLLARAAGLCGLWEHLEDPDHAERPTPRFLVRREVLAARRPDAEGPVIDVDAQAPVPVRRSDMAAWLGALRPGRFVIGHIGWSPALSTLLAELGVRHLFILRDPRAALVSLLDFVLNTRGMPAQHFLRADFEALDRRGRLDLLIDGGEAPLAGVRVRPFAEVLAAMDGWRHDPRCLVSRFEDLVGEPGGGDAGRQREALRRVALHLGVSPDPALLDRSHELFSTRSRTFRRGSRDGWRAELGPEERARVEACCAQALALWG